MSGQIYGNLEPKFNPFDDNYLAEIVETTAIAWSRMEHPGIGEIEDHITFRLAGRLANDPHFADIPYDIIPQHWLLGLNGERLGRLDIRFKHRQSQRDYFAFESKRLHVTYPGGTFSTEYPTYTGDEGMMAFVEGHYSKGFSAGGMLAYVMDGKCDKALDGLEKRIEARRIPLKLFENSTLAKSALSHSIKSAMVGTHLAETKHDLSTHRLRILHLVLPVHIGFSGVQTGVP
jgi:hypothetical protein